MAPALCGLARPLATALPRKPDRIRHKIHYALFRHTPPQGQMRHTGRGSGSLVILRRRWQICLILRFNRLLVLGQHHECHRVHTLFAERMIRKVRDHLDQQSCLLEITALLRVAVERRLVIGWPRLSRKRTLTLMLRLLEMSRSLAILLSCLGSTVLGRIFFIRLRSKCRRTSFLDQASSDSRKITFCDTNDLILAILLQQIDQPRFQNGIELIQP